MSRAPSFVQRFAALTPPQKHAFTASLLGWTLDAFDFFLFIFSIDAIAHDFGVLRSQVTVATMLTLAMRPVGALVFGALAERFGRRPLLMVNVVSYSAFMLASAFAPSLTVLLWLRAGFGFAMGGEWGIASALTFETLPAEGRGVFSGLLQQGYVLGSLLAGIVVFVAFDALGWRGMFIIGASPALLVWYVRRHVEESPAFVAGTHKQRVSAGEMLRSVAHHWKRLLYLVLLMACFNAFSHGSQDLYPVFLKVQRHFSTRLVATLSIVGNLGALLGGIVFGALSDRIGRRKAIALAALFALPMIPLWSLSTTPVLCALGAFLVQVGVQGAWGIVPAHLTELSPPKVRALLPGFAYQLGNFAMSRLSPIQAEQAEARGDDYATVMAVTLAVVAVVLAGVALVGVEAKDAALDTA
jgi:SHS family lactate transporter-like MFS transporter